MKIFNKIRNKYSTEILLKNISIYKKEKYVSSTFYFIFGFPIFKTRNLVGEKRTFLFGIRIIKKQVNITTELLKYANGKRFIYISYHTGEFYYLACMLKQNFEKYKDIKIISKFQYLK